MSGTNTNTSTHYDVLGIDDPRNTDQAAIRKAYLRTSLRCHPDKNPGREEEAKAEFVEVGQAYNILKDVTKRAAYDRELATGKGWSRPRPQRTNYSNQSNTDRPDTTNIPNNNNNDDFDSFMNMFDETVSGMSDEELNMAMGAAAVVGSIIGSIVGARAGKGNSFLSSAASMVGSAMASQAASKLVQTVHEDSTQRALENRERSAAIARGEKIPDTPKRDGREQIFKDASKVFQKVAGVAVGGGVSSSTGQFNVRSCAASKSTNNSTGFSWGEAAKIAVMAATACAELNRKDASNQKK